MGVHGSLAGPTPWHRVASFLTGCHVLRLGRLFIDATLRKLSIPHHLTSCPLSLPRLPRISTLPPFSTLLEKYKRKTKQDLAKHPLLPRLQSCDSPEAILTVLREQTPEFDQSQNSDDGLTKWVTPTVNVLYSFSATLGGVAGLVSVSIFSCDIVQSNIYYLPGIPKR